MNVQIVTDSTCDIPRGLGDQLGIRVVPTYVRFGDRTYRDSVDISTEEFYRLLKNSSHHPATAQPNPEDFSVAFGEHCEVSRGIVCITISSKISGTYSSALTASKALQSRCPVEVIDSGLNSAGLGLVVMAAARLARSGAGFDDIVAEAERAIAETTMFGMFATMKYLARGGRISRTVAAASQFLHVMPLLTFRDGQIERAGLVRTVAKGIEKIEQFVRENLPVAELLISHSQVPERAQQLKERLSRFMGVESISIAELGPGLGAHGGPGVLLVALRAS
jgi:DegV family protein with EDD domain